MYEELRAKLEEAAEKYTNLLIKRIEAAEKTETTDLATTCESIDTAIRSFGYIIAMLEKVDRLSCKKDGQND